MLAWFDLYSLRDRAKAALSRRLRRRNRAKAALERYGLRGARFAWLKGEEGQGKLLFRVQSPARGRFLLRIHEPRHRTEDALRSELLWLQALRRETSLAVPEPVPALDGSLVSAVSFEGEPRRCVLLSWQPGRHKMVSLSPLDLSLAGQYVARLHRHSERYAAPEGFVGSRAWDWDWLFGEAVPLWNKGESVYSPGEMDVFRAAAERVRRDLQELGQDSSVFGAIHRDLIPRNLVFRDGEVYAIDFENCGWGYYLFDLAVTISALEYYGGRCAPMQAAFLDGYQRERPLPEGQYLETFMAMRVVRRVNRVLASPTRLPWGPRCLRGSVVGLEVFLASDAEPVDFRYPWWRKSYYPWWREAFGWGPL